MIFKTEIEFHGGDLDWEINSHAELYAKAWEVAMQFRGAYIKVYTSTRSNPHEHLEWPMSIATPQGRKSLTLFQKSSTASVQVKPNANFT